MDKEIISQLAKKYVYQFLDGQEIENPKLEFKREWYNLKSKPGVNEFLKDTTAIANTFGPDGYLIIGVDEKNRTIIDVNFSESQLKDTNELLGVINKGVDRAFDLNYLEMEIDNRKIGVIHIPPSLDKPHVVKNYQTFNKSGEIKRDDHHRIFVRSGSTTRVATKNDIELMLYDRKNIHPDYILEVYINEIRFGSTGKDDTVAICIVNVENTGKRPASIISFNLNIYIGENEFSFSNAEAEIDLNGRQSLIGIYSRNIVIKSNDIIQKQMRLYYSEQGSKLGDRLNRATSGINKIEAELLLNNGRRMVKECNLMFKQK